MGRRSAANSAWEGVFLGAVTAAAASVGTLRSRRITGFEALAVRWLFPNQTVRIDAPCLDCGEPLKVEMRDERILSVQPDTTVGYTHSPIGGSREDIPFR
ncbi:MAG: hypothetical protein WA005_04725 [Candidatus Binataceae bacterium]